MEIDTWFGGSWDIGTLPSGPSKQGSIARIKGDVRNVFPSAWLCLQFWRPQEVPPHKEGTLPGIIMATPKPAACT